MRSLRGRSAIKGHKVGGERVGRTGVGWRDVSKSSEDSLVRKKKKVSRPRIFLVLFLFFPPQDRDGS